MERIKRKVSKRKIAFITAGVILVMSVGGCLYLKNKAKTANSQAVINTDVITYGSVRTVTTGQAAVQAYEEYDIISMVSGDIVSCPYEVDDVVNEGDVLYQFDTESLQKSIERQEISLEQSKNNYNNSKKDYSDAVEKLSITAPCDGIISGLTIKKGNDVSNNQQIAKIENTKDLEVSLPFTAEQIDKIYLGQSANVSSSVHMSIVSGKVSSISSESGVQANGSKTYNVTIELENPGAFTEGLVVGAEINGMQSPGFGTLEYRESGNVKAEASGTIQKVNYSNGDFVEEGAVIATISSDAIDSQERSLTSSELNYKSAQLSMSETIDSLDDYSITSPITGTVIEKNAKAGDTIDRTNSSTALMVVADISKLKFTLEVDELDINAVREDQVVDITCDALPNERFFGRITSIPFKGESTNGVTTYSVEVVIDEPGNLRPGMNVDASIIIDSAENVLIAPVGDIKTVMGVSYVFLKDETGKRGATEEDFMKAMGGGRKSEPNKMPQSKGNNQKRKSMLPEAPEGFVVAVVETGISDEDYIEIKSGLEENDEILQLATQVQPSNSMMEMMGMMGGGGGRPSGGGMRPGGGMPGGGMR